MQTLPHLHYKSRDFAPEQVAERTIAFRFNMATAAISLYLFEIDAKKYTIRELQIDPNSLPAERVAKARDLAGTYPNHVGLLPGDIDLALLPS